MSAADGLLFVAQSFLILFVRLEPVRVAERAAELRVTVLLRAKETPVAASEAALTIQLLHARLGNELAVVGQARSASLADLLNDRLVALPDDPLKGGDQAFLVNRPVVDLPWIIIEWALVLALKLALGVFRHRLGAFSDTGAPQPNPCLRGGVIALVSAITVASITVPEGRQLEERRGAPPFGVITVPIGARQIQLRVATGALGAIALGAIALCFPRIHATTCVNLAANTLTVGIAGLAAAGHGGAAYTTRLPVEVREAGTASVVDGRLLNEASHRMYCMLDLSGHLVEVLQPARSLVGAYCAILWIIPRAWTGGPDGSEGKAHMEHVEPIGVGLAARDRFE